MFNIGQWNLTQGDTSDLIMFGISIAFVFALVGLVYDLTKD